MYLSGGSCLFPILLKKTEIDLEVYPLKYCPRCNFTFADFHHVCDFDGAQLVSEPERQSMVSSKRSRVWRFFKSPALLAAVGLIAVVGSAFLIGYYDVVNQTSLRVVPEPSPTLTATAPLVEDSARQTSNQITTANPRKKVTSSPRSIKSSRFRATSSSAGLSLPRKSPSNKVKSEATRRTSETHQQKDPVLIAMLKTTWRVLKRPFKF